MNPLFLAAQEVFGVLQEFKVPACLIGGMALQRWGEPRLTLDIDLTFLASTLSGYALPRLTGCSFRICK